jgi:hypothetical protein
MEGSLRGHDVKWLALCRPGECAFADRARSQGRATGKRKERAAVSIYDTAEGARLRLNEQRVGHWNRWGPYLAERAWGTVREDYSADGCAWEYFPHDHARSRVYRWNEDGLGGICDRRQYLCFAPALWNGRDPILKERMFGLTNSQGNHGEDVKEYYYYLDNTPSHSYMRFLYKYPQAAYPYERLIRENAARSRLEPEYELLDTGVFDESRYFDVEIEYAKLAAEDIFIRIGVANRGPEPAAVTVLPTLWFRNTWSWGRDDRRPTLGLGASNIILAEHWELGRYALYCDEPDEIVFTENETNSARLFGWPSRTPYVKDAFHAYVVDGRLAAVDPTRRGTKAAALYRRTLPAGTALTILLRLAKLGDAPDPDPFADADAAAVFARRKAEADEFYAQCIPATLSDEEKRLVRQAFAGQLWSKQFYHYVVEDWLAGDPGQPAPPAERRNGRNHEWRHVFCRDVIAMPDTWEFPWFAAWDLGFHCRTLVHIDPQFAKDQIILMFREWYSKEDGQVPAYEWAFGDVNPPVLGDAALRVFLKDRELHGNADYAFLEEVFHKLIIAFTWWTNRKDALGNDVFQGGFLGLDNVGPFDRGALPPGYLLGQVDGTAWMGAFSRNLFEIALTLAERDSAYEGIASKFWRHFITIANALNPAHDPGDSLWDERDGFFYDRLQYPDGRQEPIRVRSVVGLVPLFSSVAIPSGALDRFPAFKRRRDWFIEHRPALMETIPEFLTPGADGHTLMALVRTDQLRRLLSYVFDEDEFLSPYGVRSVSKYHAAHPFVISIDGREARLDYEPGESTTGTFGGNSNWRGPIWLPMNILIIEGLERLHRYYGDGFTIECPTGSGRMVTLHEAARELADRLVSLFLRAPNGRRPVNGPYERFDTDPFWRELIPFHEYFHAETGRGCGASHQTGWTAMIAPLLIDYARLAAEFAPAESS